VTKKEKEHQLSVLKEVKDFLLFLKTAHGMLIEIVDDKVETQLRFINKELASLQVTKK